MTKLLFPGFPGGRIGVGLLIVRLISGAAMMLHGWPKIQNAMSWMGPEAPVPGFLQAAAAVAEFGGGIAWMLGALTPLFSLLMLATMGFAAFGYHLLQKGDPFVAGPEGGGSYEPALGYFGISLLLLLAGPGLFSLDALLFCRRCAPAATSEPGTTPRKV